MRQAIEFVDEPMEAGQTARKVRMTQEMREFALTRDEVMFLSRIPDSYLLDEVRARKFIVEGDKIRKDIGTLCLDCMTRTGMTIYDLNEQLIRVALDRFRGEQYRAAAVLGMSRRAINYHATGKTKDRKYLYGGRERKHEERTPAEKEDE